MRRELVLIRASLIDLLLILSVIVFTLVVALFCGGRKSRFPDSSTAPNKPAALSTGAAREDRFTS